MVIKYGIVLLYLIANNNVLIAVYIHDYVNKNITFIKYAIFNMLWYVLMIAVLLY